MLEVIEVISSLAVFTSSSILGSILIHTIDWRLKYGSNGLL